MKSGFKKKTDLTLTGCPWKCRPRHWLDVQHICNIL